MKEVAAAEPTEPAAELDVELDIALSMFLIEEAASMSMMSIDYGKKNCGKSPKSSKGPKSPKTKAPKSPKSTKGPKSPKK